MKILLDTNIICALIDPEHSQLENNELPKLISENNCGVSYGTLFELVSKYRNDTDMINRILIFLTKNNILIAANSEVDVEQFYRLAYSGEELSLFELQTIADSLLKQALNGVNNLLAELFRLFSVSYAYMKLNKTDDAYYQYLVCSAKVSNNFDTFHPVAFQHFSGNFVSSYVDNTAPKFESFIKSQFSEIVATIESRYAVLGNKPEDYILNLDWEVEFRKSYDDFLKEHTISDYQSVIRSAYRELKQGKKRKYSIDDLLSMVDCSHLSALWKDFFLFYLKRLLTGAEVFKYNDIIDFINLKIAVQETDCLLTLDFKFLEERVSQFASIADSEFYRKSLAFSRQIKGA